MHAKSGLRVVLKWKICRPDSVIAAVIRLRLSPMQFSIKSLLLLITIAAGIAASFAAFGPNAIWIVAISALFAIGIAAHKNDSPAPFWGCLVSVLILGFLMPPVGRYTPTNEELIVQVLMFVLGGYLAYSGIKRGHWATKTLAAVLFSTYAFVIISLIANVMA